MTRKQALRKALKARKEPKVATKPRQTKAESPASGYAYTKTLYKPQAPRPRPRLPYHDNPPSFGEPNVKQLSGRGGGRAPRIRITIQTD